MFQAAFAHQLSIRHGVNALLVDATSRASTGRNWELGAFGIMPHRMSVCKREVIILADAIARKCLPSRYKPRVGVLQEEPRIGLSVISNSAPWLVSGYWQGCGYVREGRKAIKSLLPFPMDARSAWGQGFPVSGSVVGMHVRRGDYAGNSKTARYHNVCSASWYRSAWDHVRTRCESPKLVVFSEDPEWVCSKVNPVGDVEYVPYDRSRPAWMDLYALSQCRHFILSNSSFSWWAAYLGQTQESMVVVPSQWYPGVETAEAGMLVQGWVPLAVSI